MAEENKNISHGYQPAAPATHEESEIKDRGMFDFLGKKKEEEEVAPASAYQNVVIATELEQVHVSDQCEQPDKKAVVHQVEVDDEKKHHSSLLGKFHHDSSSSSSSEEEVEEEGQKIRRKKKKGLKEKIHEHISHEKPKVEEPEKKIDYYEEEDTTVLVEKCDDVVVTHQGVVPHPEEKKGFMEKIKEKFPGHKKPAEEEITHPVASAPVVHEYSSSTTDAVHHGGEETKEKKGFLEKIKEKLPGCHKNEDHHEEKKETTSHY